MENSHLTRKELKTLKNALGKQGLSLKDHENAQESAEPCKILNIDCFSLEKSEIEGDWYVGFGVEYNGVGVSAAQESSTSDEEEEGSHPEQNQQVSEESSGFSSNSQSDDESDPGEFSAQNHSDSDDFNEKGQLLYGVEEAESGEPVFFVDRQLCGQESVFVDGESFKTGKLVTTARFPVSKIQAHAEKHHGYELIAADNVPQVVSHSDDEAENSSSSGLWCNFVISPPDLEESVWKAPKRVEIPEHNTIVLNSEKCAQIEAAMSGFQLPTPPGWEGISDEKILDFIRQRL
uniref:Uncharacterized protein n=1 Tax=Caenorhabditis japonica TaxID=281687 RepID=A0A8R1DLQ1_CAEJA